MIYFEDPDHNQFEFWAPDRLPEGAMQKASRSALDASVTASQSGTSTAPRPSTTAIAASTRSSADIPDDTLVFPSPREPDRLQKGRHARRAHRRIHALARRPQWMDHSRRGIHPLLRKDLG